VLGELLRQEAKFVRGWRAMSPKDRAFAIALLEDQAREPVADPAARAACDLAAQILRILETPYVR
jgi:hypothetical protein